MHAVAVAVSIEGDEEEAAGFLRENIVPMVSQLPGFVAGIGLGWSEATRVGQ